MLERIDAFLDVDLENPDQNRKGRLLNVLLLGVGVITIIAFILLFVTDVFGLAENTAILYIGVLAVLVGNVAVYQINRRGNPDLASTIFLGLLTAVFSFADTPQNVVQGRSIFMFVIPILMASFLLRPYASFVMAAVISVIQIFMAVINSVPDYSPIGLVAFFAIALVAWLAANGLENALSELRVINRELDQRVIERTHELAEANLQLEHQARELVKVNLQLEQQAHELADANQRLTELDRLKSKFVSDVSHELRTPISNLTIYLEMLENAPPERSERYRAVLRDETKRLEKLVSDILDLSRMEMGRAKVVFGWNNLNSIAEQVVVANQARAEVKGLEISLIPADDLPQVWSDANQLNQAINNLVGNAINYTPRGSVQVSTLLDTKRELVLLKVRDTGYGISEDDLPYLFDRFYRGRQAGQSTIPGTGLGLSITKEIVDGHRGSIEIVTKESVGSTFTICLPLDKQVDDEADSEESE